MRTDFIAKRKRALKLTNQDISEMTGITVSTLEKITSGANTNPKLETVRALAKALQCTLDELDDEGAGYAACDEKEMERVSAEALAVAQDYDTLDQRGKTVVRGVLDLECEFVRRMSAGTNSERTPAMQAYLERRTKKPG